MPRRKHLSVRVDDETLERINVVLDAYRHLYPSFALNSSDTIRHCVELGLRELEKEMGIKPSGVTLSPSSLRSRRPSRTRKVQ